MIDLVNLHKSFGDLHVLRGVTFSVRKGETHVVLGRSGTGKSVLARSIAGRIAPPPGAVVLRSDVIRKELAGVDALTRLPGAASTGGPLAPSSEGALVGKPWEQMTAADKHRLRNDNPAAYEATKAAHKLQQKR